MSEPALLTEHDLQLVQTIVDVLRPELDQRFAAFEEKMDCKFAAFEEKIDRKLDQRFAAFEERLLQKVHRTVTEAMTAHFTQSVA